MALDLPTLQPQARAALMLQIWLSPSFPVGAFAYSHGLERAVEAGLVRDRADLTEWIADLLLHGSIRNDLIIATATWRAVTLHDQAALYHVAELAAALQPSAERRLESITQGGSFLDAAVAWPTPAIAFLRNAWDGDIAYPVALASAAAGHGIALGPLLEAYGVAFASNLASAAIRLGVIGQTGAQRIISGLLAAIASAAGEAAAFTLDDLGSASWSADLASLEHETQYTRLFRS